MSCFIKTKRKEREGGEGAGEGWCWICIMTKSLSRSLFVIYLFIYFQQRSKRITSHLQLVSGIRRQFAAARGQRMGANVCWPLHHNLLFIKEIFPPLPPPPTFCTFYFSCGGPNSDQAPRPALFNDDLWTWSRGCCQTRVRPVGEGRAADAPTANENEGLF